MISDNVIKVEEVIRANFPTSEIERRSILGTNCIALYISSGEKERQFGYKQNDILKFSVWVDDKTHEFYEGDVFYYHKPIKNKYLCYETKSFRKVAKTNDLSKFLKSLDKQLKKLKQSLLDDLNAGLIEDTWHRAAIVNNLKSANKYNHCLE